MVTLLAGISNLQIPEMKALSGTNKVIHASNWSMHPCSAVTSKIKKDLKRTNIRPTSKNVAFESGAGQQHCIDKDMKRAAALSLVEGGGLKTHPWWHSWEDWEDRLRGKYFQLFQYVFLNGFTVFVDVCLDGFWWARSFGNDIFCIHANVMTACHVPRFTPSLSLPCLVISMKTLAMVQFQWKHLQNRITVNRISLEMSSQSYRLNVSYRWPSVNLRMTGSIPQKTKQTFHVFFQAESDNILHWHHQ